MAHKLNEMNERTYILKNEEIKENNEHGTSISTQHNIMVMTGRQQRKRETQNKTQM